MIMKEQPTQMIYYMPSGKPAPYVMTSVEAVEFLRAKNERTLKYWRDEGLLIGFRIGHRLCYTLDELLRFLTNKQEHTLKKQ